MKTFNNPEDGFIQSFRALRELPITLSQVNFLELVYSYTKIEGGQFYDTNENIGKYLMMSPNSAGNLVNFMSDEGYITRDKVGNTNQRGWTRYITLNIDFINQKLNKVSEVIQPEIAPQIASISLEVYDTEPIVVTTEQIEIIEDIKEERIPEPPIEFGNFQDEEPDLITPEMLQQMIEESPKAELTKDEIRQELMKMLWNNDTDEKLIDNIRTYVNHAWKYTDDEYSKFYQTLVN